MQRREFITLLGGAATWPLAASAQQGQAMRRIGVLVNGPETDAEVVARLAAFLNGLQKLGWVPGANLQVDIRYGVDNNE
ncbi:MAG: ABC transporter substrate-binding protein, partial [Pseudolabrys sp.]